MKSEMLLSVLLGILIVVSAIQAYQLVNLKESISSGTVAVSSSSAQYSSASPTQQSASAGNQQSVPSGLQNAPNMVGGC